MFPETTSDRRTHFFRILIILCFLVFAAVVRILPHPWNFTPIGAMALFGGAKFGRSWKAFLFPLAGLFFGDAFVGFHRLIPIVYLSFCLSVLIGMLFRRKQTLGPLSIATLLGATQFFLISNFAMWVIGTNYTKSLTGLLACYTAAIPLFGNTLAGDAFYTLLLFGGFAVVERLSPALKISDPISAR